MSNFKAIPRNNQPTFLKKGGAKNFSESPCGASVWPGIYGVKKFASP